MATTLYRPVGLEELALIWDSGCREFPLRLPNQPIFYPVTSSEYAAQIARDWNTKATSFAGYVTSFNVDDEYLAKFERHIVGSTVHEEYWIPAEQVPSLNRAMRSLIHVESAFFADSFAGFIPERSGLKDKNAAEQFQILARNLAFNRMDFVLEVSVNRKAVYLNCLFWTGRDLGNLRIGAEEKQATLSGVVEAWRYCKIAPGLPAVFLKAVQPNNES